MVTQNRTTPEVIELDSSGGEEDSTAPPHTTLNNLQ